MTLTVVAPTNKGEAAFRDRTPVATRRAITPALFAGLSASRQRASTARSVAGQLAPHRRRRQNRRSPGCGRARRRAGGSNSSGRSSRIDPEPEGLKPPGRRSPRTLDPLDGEIVAGEPERLALPRAAVVEAEREIDERDVEAEKADDRPGADRDKADARRRG